MEGFGVHRSSPSTAEIEEEPAVPRRAEEEEEKVYVAVAKELKEGKNNLGWVLQNFSRNARIVIVHVHRPAQWIPIMGAKFHANRLEEQQVEVYRQHEREKMNNSLDEYLHVFQQLKVCVEKLVTEMDDIAKGLVALIDQHGITRLVMGAASDKHYSKKMKVLKSKTAISVKQQANQSCKIWFICKGNLIFTREPEATGHNIPESPISSPGSHSSQPEQLHTISLPQRPSESVIWSANPMQVLEHKSGSADLDSDGGVIVTTAPMLGSVGTLSPGSMEKAEGIVTDPWERNSRMSSRSSQHSLQSVSDEMLTNLDSPLVLKGEDSEEGPVVVQSLDESDDDLQFLSARYELENEEDAEVYDKIQQALTVSENLKREAYEVVCRCQKAEKDAVEAARRAKAAEQLYIKEARKRKTIEEELDILKLEVETLKNQQVEILVELQNVNEQNLEFELQVSESYDMVKGLEEKLSASQYLLYSLQERHKELQRELDNLVSKAEELRQKDYAIVISQGVTNFPNFSYMELEEATRNFDCCMKIGETVYGTVYKGFLRNTMVSIKMLNCQDMEGLSQFQQQLDVLGRLRHPNLVTLVGACPEALALVYEFLPNRSLEDCLSSKEITPLKWQARIRIAAEICSTLIFLHSNKPYPMIHGDLKPDNILLDVNYVSKLRDTGISYLFRNSKTIITSSSLIGLCIHPNDSVYMDPEFLDTGKFTPLSDVYSFGLIMLRLLTGRSALGIVEEVHEAFEKDYLHEIIDPLAGSWPYSQAKQFAELGLQCCKMNQRSCPDLAESWRLLDTMAKTAATTLFTLPLTSDKKDDIFVPHYFMCPIMQDIMRDPHIATDGFTYEAEAIKNWFDSGHNTSPMTNLRLSNCNLVPNRALQFAIQEWLAQHY